jgi:hypothetical protein
MKRYGLAATLGLAGLAGLPLTAPAAPPAQDWEVLNPAGIVETKMMALAPRITSLDGKVVVLRWNGKHNGDNFLDRTAELLKEHVPTAKVIKLYEVDPSTVRTSGSPQESARIAQVIKGLKADIVIAAQAD